MNKTRELTRENFDIFLGWLAPEREKAGEVYEKLRFRLITFFSARRCAFAEELADEVINRVVVIVGSNGTELIENKTSYVYGVARNVYLESLRREKNHTNIDDVQIAANPHTPKDFSNHCLNFCLDKLDSDKREFILDYFSQSKSAKVDLHKQLAEDLQIAPAAMRMRVMRIKQQLSDCVKTCMK
jgi:DNA-directed RNA polymerase specialized sigma24 family protein